MRPVKRIIGILKTLLSPFSKLEQALLNSLLGAFEGQSRSLLEAQIRSVSKVQRHRKSKEVILFRMRGFRVYRNPGISFPAGEEEVRFAVITFSILGKMFKADFWITRGFFSVIEFDKSPSRFAGETKVERLRVRVLRDPMTISRRPQEERLLSADDLVGDVKDLVKQCSALKILHPLERGRIDESLAASGFDLPRDLLPIISQINGFDTEHCEFLGVESFRPVESGGDEFIIIAEHETKGVMAFRRSSPDAGYFVLDYEGGNPVFLSRDYRSSAIQLCVSEDNRKGKK